MQPSKGWFAGDSNLCLTPLRRGLIWALKCDLSQLWGFLQRSKCFSIAELGSFGLVWEGQCCCYARKKVQGLRCPKPFSGAARAAPQNISRGDATPAPPDPEGGDENAQSNANRWAYRCHRRTAGVVFTTLLHWALPLATHRIPARDKLSCLTGWHAALCLWVFFCYAKGRSKPWFMWGYSHCFALWEGFWCVF